MGWDAIKISHSKSIKTLHVFDNIEMSNKGNYFSSKLSHWQSIYLLYLWVCFFYCWSISKTQFFYMLWSCIVIFSFNFIKSLDVFSVQETKKIQSFGFWWEWKLLYCCTVWCCTKYIILFKKYQDCLNSFF